MKREHLKKLILSAFFLALCMLLPLLTGQIPQIGNALSPMHIPVFLCGFVCGWPYAAAIGLIAPPMRYLIFGMPPIFPTGVAMAIELCTYGLVAGLLYKLLPKKPINVFVALIASMLAGRVMWGIARVLMSGAAGSPFTWELFFADAFVKAVPGIICHIILVPAVILALRKAKVISYA